MHTRRCIVCDILSPSNVILLRRVLMTKAREVSKLTPQVIGHAEEVARDPAGRQRQLEDLQLSSHQWAGHVSQLIEATQKANYPWSKTAERLVSAAKRGEGLETQVSRFRRRWWLDNAQYVRSYPAFFFPLHRKSM